MHEDEGLAARDLVDGQHRNPTRQRGYFTTAHFRYPTGIAEEATGTGFHVEATLAIESMAGFMPSFDQFWSDESLRQRLPEFLRMIEREPTMLGATGHHMLICVKR